MRVLVRPEGVRLSADGRQGAPATLVERRVSAGHTLLSCRLGDGRLVHARGALTDTFMPGDTIRLWVDPAYAHVTMATEDQATDVAPRRQRPETPGRG